MTHASIMYVSRSLIPPAEAIDAVATIVARARLANSERGITGALLFTGQYFAQQLEGPSDAVQDLVERIKHDARHADVSIIDRSENIRAEFNDWSMAYNGPSLFVNRHVGKLLMAAESADRRRSALWLRRLMKEFVRDQ